MGDEFAYSESTTIAESYPWDWKFNKYWRDSTVFSLLALNPKAFEQVGA